VAPAGFGKSTLAAAYARESGGAVGWLTLLAGDRHSRTFFSHVASALESAFECDSAMSALRGGLRDGAESVGLARLALADLAQAPAGFILVLDDFHVLKDADEVLQAVDALVRGLPRDAGQVVITAREPPLLSMTQLVASDSVFALGVEDLRFVEDEVRALRASLGGSAANDERAEGWVAGILLGGAPRELGSGFDSVLTSYVEREVVERLAPEEQYALESLAVVEEITPQAVERLLGEGTWFGQLDEVARRCSFLAPRDDGSFRLHSLIRDSFLHRLRRGDPRRAERAWSIARDLAEEVLDTAGVVRACQELGRLDDAIGLVRDMAEDSRRTGRWSGLLSMLELLPQRVRRADPWLSLLEAQALYQRDRPEPAREAADAALRHGGRTGDVPVQINATLELATISRHQGDMGQAEDWLTAADYLLANNRDLQPAERRSLEGRSLTQRGVCAAIRGEMERAREAFESAERLLAVNGPSRELALAQHNLGKLCTQTGDLTRAQAALATAVMHWRLVGDRTMLSLSQGVLGALYLRMGDLDRSGTALQAVIVESRAVGAVRVEAHAVLSLGEWHRASGRLEDAADLLDTSIKLAEEVGERELLVTALEYRAEVAIVRGDLPGARRLLARGQAEGQLLGGDIEQAGIELALGRLHLAEGAGQQAIFHLEAALERGACALAPSERLTVCYWLGTTHLAMGRPALAERLLGEVIELARSAGGAGVLARPAAEDPALLQYGLRLGLDPAFLAEAERIAATHQPWTGVEPPSKLELVASNDMPRVEVRMFGSFALHCDGELATSGARGRVDRARELLALLVLHPSGLSDSEIVELLWADMGPERARHNLRMTVYLLRRLLGSKATVRLKGANYSLAPQLELWSDVREFDAGLRRARLAPGEAARSDLDSAISLYRGALLSEVEWPWVEPFRLSYQTRLVDAALHLADVEAARNPGRSDALAEQVLAIEPDNEPAYERLTANAKAHGDALAYRRALHRYQRAAAQYGFRPRRAQ
jgi:LuxR family maltose regulon positive regulatory protein